jgi:hypothetical protein
MLAMLANWLTPGKSLFQLAERSGKIMKKLFATIVVTLIAFLVISYGSSVQAQTLVPRATLSGAEEVPPVETGATGVASFDPNEAGTELNFVLFVSGLTNITMAHVHVGDVGANGPIIFNLATSPDAFKNGVAGGTLTASSLMPAGGITTFEEAIKAIYTGRCYVNAHTQAHPDGEIRGQILPYTQITILAASLTGDEEVPPVKTKASGLATFDLNEAGTELGFVLSVADIMNIRFAHIHVGDVGTNGPIIFNLATSPDAFVKGVATGTLTASSLMPAGGISTFDEALEAIYSGRCYANVHTQAHPDGEIRGQIAPITIELPPSQ